MNKVILITGASTGFGRTAAETLAQRGYRVFATMRDVTGRNSAVAEELRSQAKRKAWSLDPARLSEKKATTLGSKSSGPLRDVLERTERQRILEALEQSNWVVAGPRGAAGQLGMKRSTLQQRIRKLGITRGTV